MSVKTIKGSTAAAAFLAATLSTGCATQHVENPKPADGAQPGVCILEVAGQGDGALVAPVVYGDAGACAKALVESLIHSDASKSKPTIAHYYDREGNVLDMSAILASRRPITQGMQRFSMCNARGSGFEVNALGGFAECADDVAGILLGTETGAKAGEGYIIGTLDNTDAVVVGMIQLRNAAGVERRELAPQGMK